MSPDRLQLALALSMALASLLGQGACSASADLRGANADGQGGFTAGSGGGGGVDGGGDVLLTYDALDQPSPGYAALCGAGACVPGEPETCAPDVDGGRDGGEPDGTPAPPPALDCKLVAARGGESPACLPAGQGAEGDPCHDATGCAPGFGCAAATAGICFRYCCGDPEACPKATFCTPRPMQEDVALEIPVCYPTQPCTLLAPGACPEGQACTIVRNDGTTSCVAPGTGTVGEPCDEHGFCAEGHVCAQALWKCKKLCHTGPNAAECPGGKCQGGSDAYPEGFGVCVGASY